MRRRSENARLIKYLDKMLHDIVVDRDKHRCRRCGSQKRVVASHIWPKGKYPSMRYLLLNVKALCWHCHETWWHRNPIEAATWVLDALGRTKYEMLSVVAGTTGKVNRQNDRLYLEAEMKKRGLPLPAPPKISVPRKRGRVKA